MRPKFVEIVEGNREDRQLDVLMSTKVIDQTVIVVGSTGKTQEQLNCRLTGLHLSEAFVEDNDGDS